MHIQPAVDLSAIQLYMQPLTGLPVTYGNQVTMKGP